MLVSGQVFENGVLAEELTVFTDSDWAGCKETRRSSSASVLMLGRHTLKAHTRKQKVIAKSSAEAELYAATLGASEAKGVQSMMFDLGFAVKLVLAIDAKATEHILHKQGIGKLKHIAVAYVSVQDEIRSKRLRVGRVRSEENVADLGTKPLSKAVIAKHCLTLGYMSMDEKRFRVDGKWWRCCGTSVQQQVTMSRSQPAVTRSNRKIRSGGSEHREIALHCLGLQPTAQIDFGRYRRGENVRDHPRKQHQSRNQTFPLHRTRDKLIQNIMKCDDGIRKDLHECHVVQWHGRAQKDQ